VYFGWSALNVGQHPDVCELLVLHDPRLPQCCLRHRTVKIEIPICQTRYIGSPGRAGLWLNQGMSLWGQYDFFNCISLSPVLQYTIGLRPKKLIKLDLWECHKFASSGLALARIFAVKTQHKTLLVTRNVLTLEKAKRAKKNFKFYRSFQAFDNALILTRAAETYLWGSAQRASKSRNVQYSARFLTTFDFDREYLRKGSKLKLYQLYNDYNLSDVGWKKWWTLVY